MDIKKIKIPSNFKYVSPKKVVYAKDYISKYGVPDKHITVNQDGYLVDGYARYEAYKQLKHTYVPVETVSTMYAICKHDGNNKKYYWKIPLHLTNDIKDCIGKEICVENEENVKNIRLLGILDDKEIKKNYYKSVISL